LAPTEVAERLRGDRAHRTDVDHVAGQLGIDRAADEGLDLGVLAAMGDAQLRHAGHFLAMKRTQRVHWMQRVITVSRPAGPMLVFTARLFFGHSASAERP
jgi:hypothetical protein